MFEILSQMKKPANSNNLINRANIVFYCDLVGSTATRAQTSRSTKDVEVKETSESLLTNSHLRLKYNSSDF